jgi:hypothetical protein
MNKTKPIKKSENEIVTFFHCRVCLETIPDGVSPRENAQLEVGWTPAGLQVWCKRHEKNVMNLDFLGQKVGYA